MRFWLDIEASSLAVDSYPIEIGWVAETGEQPESILIKPEPSWIDWSEASEHLHCIARPQLERDGVSCRAAARLISEQLTGQEVFSDDPLADQVWLNRLFAAAGSDCPVRLIDSSRADVLACVALVISGRRQSARPAETLQIAQNLIAGAHIEAERRRRQHRAGPDAQRLRDIYLTIRRAADHEASQLVHQDG